MWLSFALAVIVCLVLLYLPGFLLCRGLGLSSLSAFATAPLVDVACYCLVGLAYARLGVFSTTLNVFLPVLALGAVLFILRFVKRGGQVSVAGRGDWLAMGLYAIVGLVLGIYLFASALDMPYSIVSEYDNAFHLSVVRAFAESGVWSVLDVSKYMTPEDLAITPLGGNGFYPACWHIVCALVATLFDNSAALAENAVNFTIAAFVFPLSMAYLFMSIFKKRRIVYLGSLTTLAFVSYPWTLFIWGPVLPNVFAYALMPVIIGLFIRIVDGVTEKWIKAPGLIVFLLGFVTLAFTQPNAVFFCIVFLTPYCVWRIWTLPEDIVVRGHRISRKGAAVAFVALVIVIWVVLVYAPFFHNLIFAESWRSELSIEQAVSNVFTLGFGWFSPQWILAVVVLIGIVFSLVHRRYLWITVAYLYFCIAYVLCVATDGLLQLMLGGFWYADFYRLAACIAIVGVLVAAMGLEAVIELLERLLSKHRNAFYVCVAAMLMLFCFSNYAPVVPIGGNEQGHTALRQYHDLMMQSNDHNNESAHYSGSKRDFVERVKELVPEDSLVVNLPDDGSAYAYGVNGLRVYYREYRSYVDEPYESPDDETWETYESQHIRLGAADIANNEDVRQAFENIGADYVMLLDYGDALHEQHTTPFFNPALWTGLLSIRDDTPGFELVLSESDMRLYKVVSQ